VPCTKKVIVALAFLLCSIPSFAQSKAACNLPPLLHEQKDEATIERLEKAWTIAYVQGETNLERCLLTPDFKEILRSGEVKALSDELQFAANNKGKNLTVPDQPKAAVLIHGNVAVAYGTSKSTEAAGTPRITRYADYYVWENGSWHVFFAQQTQVQQP
jgi:hypothetical protein